jgi:hypothetical protein
MTGGEGRAVRNGNGKQLRLSSVLPPCPPGSSRIPSHPPSLPPSLRRRHRHFGSSAFVRSVDAIIVLFWPCDLFEGDSLDLVDSRPAQLGTATAVRMASRSPSSLPRSCFCMRMHFVQDRFADSDPPGQLRVISRSLSMLPPSASFFLVIHTCTGPVGHLGDGPSHRIASSLPSF